jgi:hypothetical protein
LAGFLEGVWFSDLFPIIFYVSGVVYCCNVLLNDVLMLNNP